ncbi:arylsulfatase [Streptomyces sp. NPDC048590]|uniref:arylsulfatase n=1 Tax=Streptomyces sp. NPDC048590 TaxID=3365574 RepID=UPI003720E8A7
MSSTEAAPAPAGRTAAESTPSWPDPPRGGRPSILTVVLDDTGWSDFGCYGSEIRTPAIDALAAGGLRFTNFHVNPMCSPTRASLFTGRNNHALGMRFIADTDTGFDNSRGRIDPAVPLLPDHLRPHGYGSYQVGKWHLAPGHEITPAGPYDNWPLRRGFDRFYGFMGGATDQRAPELFEDHHPVRPAAGPDYLLSEDLADRAISYLREHRTYRAGSPFYLNLALGATHAPLQAPRAYIERYLETFTKGWDQTRVDRLRRQTEEGLVPEGTGLTERNPGVAPWDELTQDQRTLHTHLQAVYAGFLEHADAQIGRVVDALREWGELDNTIVMVLSDNGASREGGPQGAVDVNAPYNGIPQTVEQELSRLDKLGGPEGPAHYPEGWATASNTPFRLYKQYTDLGGVRVPLVVHWPLGIAEPGGIRHQFVHAVDLAPTVLEAVGAPVDGARFDGRSMLAVLADADAPAPRDTQYFEMLGHRALWHQGWKAVTTHVPGTPYEDDVWRLYDTRRDFSECHDLAAEQPERLAALREVWESEAERHGVFPLDDRPLKALLALNTGQGLHGATHVRLEAGACHVPAPTRITGSNRSMRATATLSRTADGVLLASGTAAGGYVLYIKDGRLVFEHNLLGDHVVCASPGPLPAGTDTAGFRLHCHDDRSARVTIEAGTVPLAHAGIPMTAGRLSGYGLDIGRDTLSQVSAAYTGEFPQPRGALVHVDLDFTAPEDIEDVAATIEAVE